MRNPLVRIESSRINRIAFKFGLIRVGQQQQLKLVMNVFPLVVIPVGLQVGADEDSVRYDPRCSNQRARMILRFKVSLSSFLVSFISQSRQNVALLQPVSKFSLRTFLTTHQFLGKFSIVINLLGLVGILFQSKESRKLATLRWFQHEKIPQKRGTVLLHYDSLLLLFLFSLILLCPGLMD